MWEFHLEVSLVHLKSQVRVGSLERGVVGNSLVVVAIFKELCVIERNFLNYTVLSHPSFPQRNRQES